MKEMARRPKYPPSDADRRRKDRAFATGPALPQMQSTCRLRIALRFVRIVNPDELEHGVGEEETPVGGALPWMSKRAAFDETEPDEPVAFRRAGRRTYEDVIDFHCPVIGHGPNLAHQRHQHHAERGETRTDGSRTSRDLRYL
jgi:hypothetical protein